MVKKEVYGRISEFMRVFSAVTGVVMGFGFIFIGFTNKSFLIILFAILSLMAGLISIPTLLREKDEYESLTEDS